MGITLNQFDQLAGGFGEGYMRSQSNRRFNAKNKREQATEDRTALDFKQEQDAKKSLQDRTPIVPYEQTFKAIQISRENIDTKWAGGGAAAGPRGVGGATVAGPQIQGGIGALPQAADGGPVEVDPGAVPAPPGTGVDMSGSQALSTEQAPAQPAYKTRRDEYQAWYKNAGNAAAMSGGLEGLKTFQDHENALSRKQMLGYGMEGVAAMRDGNAGEASRQLNTMLDVSPEDTGMRWEAFDGKVHLVGPDGNRGKAYNQEAVMALIENNIKTPENYLAFQEQALNDRKQREVERAAPIKEGVEQQKADASSLIAKTDAGQLKLDEKYRPRETASEEARALAALIAAKSTRDRAAAALAVESNWTAQQILKIYGDADTWAFEDAMIPKEHQKAYAEDSTAWSTYKADVMNQMTHNDWDGGPTREEASQVSMFLRQPGGLNMNDKMSLKAKQDATGAVIVDYMGKQWRLPYSLGVAALNLGIIEDAVEPPPDATKDEVGGGDKEQKGPPGGALPDEPRKYGAYGAIPAAIGAVSKALTRG